MIKTINTSKLRSNFKEATRYVRESKRPLIVTERGLPTTVLVDIDVFEDYLESKDKTFVASIKAARAQKSRGEVFSLEEVFGLID